MRSHPGRLAKWQKDHKEKSDSTATAYRRSYMVYEASGRVHAVYHLYVGGLPRSIALDGRVRRTVRASRSVMVSAPLSNFGFSRGLALGLSLAAVTFLAVRARRRTPPRSLEVSPAKGDTGPRGPEGVEGARGEQGPPGTAGSSESHLASEIDDYSLKSQRW